MANFGSTMADVGFNVTNGAINQTLSVQLNNLEHMLIHGKHKGVRFYYDQTSGGNVLSVLTKSLIGGAVSELSTLAKNTFKDLLWKNKVGKMTVILVGHLQEWMLLMRKYARSMANFL